MLGFFRRSVCACGRIRSSAWGDIRDVRLALEGATDGGLKPLWSRDGRELFFWSLDDRQMFAVSVQSGTTLVAGRPQVLFEFAMADLGAGSRPYDIAPDGRFLIIRSGEADPGGSTAPNLVLVLNWTEELKRLVPTR